MRDLFGSVPGDRLALDVYRADFAQRDFAVDGWDSWKFERRQHFVEPEDASWRAYSEGDWARALELIESRRSELLQLSKLAADHDCRLLRVRAECGELIRIIGPELIAPYEQDGQQLPELITVGPDTVYDISYDATGLGDGATRYADAATRDRVVRFIARLYDQGEEIEAFMAREATALAPFG